MVKRGNIFKTALFDIKSHPLVFIISLIVSVFLFFYVGNINYKNKIFVSPIQYMNINEDHMISGNEQLKIKVFLKGKEEDLRYITLDQIKPYINCENIPIGEHILKIKIDQSLLPSSVSIKKVDPAYVTLLIDKRLKKKLNFKMATIGEPQEGFAISDIFLSTDSVLVEGPYSMLNTIEEISNIPIDITGLNTTITFNLSIDQKYLALISPNKLHAIIEIKRKYDLLTFDNIQILLKNKAEKAIYKLDIAKFKIELLAIAVKNRIAITKDMLTFTINCESFEYNGRYKVKIQPMIPADYEVLSILPEYVILTISNLKK